MSTQRLEQRTQLALRGLIDNYLAKGWLITNRYPLTIYRVGLGINFRMGA